MDFGMGVANTVLAVAEGASVIQTTVSGLGERAGNAPMEETVLALLTMYGIDMGIKTEHFTGIARLVAELTGVQQPSNRPVTGERLYHVESGIIATWVKNAGDQLTEPFPYRPELVGQQQPEIVLGKGSGLDSVAIWLDRHGIEDATDRRDRGGAARGQGTVVGEEGFARRRGISVHCGQGDARQKYLVLGTQYSDRTKSKGREKLVDRVSRCLF